MRGAAYCELVSLNPRRRIFGEHWGGPAHYRRFGQSCVALELLMLA
jgi:hypothetical protein